MLSNKILLPAGLIVGALLGGTLAAQGYYPGQPGPTTREEVLNLLQPPMQQLANFGPRVLKVDEKGGVLVYIGDDEACVGPIGPKPVWVNPVEAQKAFNAGEYIAHTFEGGGEPVIRFTDKCHTVRSK